MYRPGQQLRVTIPWITRLRAAITWWLLTGEWTGMIRSKVYFVAERSDKHCFEVVDKYRHWFIEPQYVKRT